jgi:hypothetical protein
MGEVPLYLKNQAPDGRASATVRVDHFVSRATREPGEDPARSRLQLDLNHLPAQ